MQHVPFFFTKIFFDFKSLWAIAGLPVRGKKNKPNKPRNYTSVKKIIAIILSLAQILFEVTEFLPVLLLNMHQGNS